MENRSEMKNQFITDIQQLLQSDGNAIELIEASPVCTKVVDIDFNLKYMSSAGVNDLNISDITEYYGKPYPLSFYPESFRSQMTNSLVEARRHGQIVTQEGGVTDVDGNEQYYLSTLVPVKNDRGEVESIMIVSTNITAQKKAENALKSTLANLELEVESRTSELKKSEQRFAAAMEAANDGMWDWNLESDEVYYSPRWKSMLGYKEDELDGVLDTFSRLVHPSEKDNILEMARDYVEGRAKSFEVEMNMCHKAGHNVKVLSRAFLVRNKFDGKPLRLIGTHEDITERKKSEQFILDTSDILKMIALREPKEQIYDAIAHLYESRHPGLRCSMLILEGNKLMHAGAPSMPKEYCDAVNGLQNGPEVGSCGTATYYGIRVIVEDIDKDPKWEKIKHVALPHGMRCCWSEPIKNSNGDVLGAFGMYYNHPASPNELELNDMASGARLAGIIMEREKSETELDGHRRHLEKLVSQRTRQFEEAKLEAEAANTAKSNFLANMSHEIRTPMNALLGLSELTLRTELNSAQKNYVEKIHRSAESLLGIINDILDFSKIEAGMLNIESISFNLKDTVNQVIQVFQQAALDKNLRLHLDILGEVPSQLLGDPLRLRQVLTNLLGNAVKFTARGSVKVVVRLLNRRDENVTLQISVSDTGIGMSSEQSDSIFGAFNQADSSTTREYGGTGLGLSISKHLVELMRGEIEVKSKVNEGSKFVFTVQCEEDFRFKKQNVVNPARKIPNLSGKTILLAEDNMLNQDVALGILELSKCSVIVANNGQEAVNAMKENTSVDLIIMDVQMPVMNGLDATRQIREAEAGNKRTPIIAMTGAAMDADRVHVFESGMDALITKPFSIERLYEELTTWLKSDI